MFRESLDIFIGCLGVFQESSDAILVSSALAEVVEFNSTNKVLGPLVLVGNTIELQIGCQLKCSSGGSYCGWVFFLVLYVLLWPSWETM